jgi:eukaryotic-like serine/threonine-protein kinase
MTDWTANRLARALDLVAEVCHLPPNQRDARLSEACDGDAELRVEVMSLLKHHATSDGGELLFDERHLQEGLPMQFAGIAGELSSGAPPAPLPLESRATGLPPGIGRYRVLRAIGEGGMGVVYEAEQDNPRRRVALKVIRSAAASEQVRRRFQREAHVLGQLDHPGIARIFEAGVTEDGRLPFFAMELIHGETLTDYADRHGMKTRQRLELFAHVCDAVHYANCRGVIHRDLKPANVLVDEFGQPRILDFGVARVTAAEHVVTTLHTHVGQIVGTLAYMSPEQVSGSGDPAAIDARSDVYSLGVVLFELLAGRTPIDLTGRPMAEAIRLIQDQEPSRLSSVNAFFRGDVDTIVQKALEKEKSRRYDSAGELAADIRRSLNDEPIVARPISTMYQFRKFARRNKVLVGGALGIVLALAIGLAATGIYAVRADRNAELALQRQMLAERATYRASIAAAIAALQSNDVAMARRNLEAAPNSLRGWEWRHLHSRLDGSVVAFHVPSTRTLWTSTWFSDDGRRIFTASGPTEHAVIEWDAETGEQLTEPRIVVRRLWKSPGGGAIAWIDHDRLGFETELASGKRRAFRFNAEDFGPLWCVMPAADGRSAVFDVRPGDGSVSLVYADLITGETWSTDRTIYRSHWCADAHSSGVVAIYNTDLVSDAQVWRPRSNELLTLEGHTAALTHAALSRDAALLLTTSRDNTVRLWDLAIGATIAIGRGHTDVRFGAFGPDGRLAATCGPDRTIRIWSIPTLEPLGVLSGHEAPIVSVSFSHDGQHLASICEANIVRIWQIGSGRELDPHVLRGHASFVYPVTFSPDGSMIASGGWDRVVRLWDAATMKQLATLDGCDGAIYSVAFSADGRLIAATCQDESVRVWDVISAVEIARHHGWPRGTRHLAFHPRAPRLLLDWAADRAAAYFDPAEGSISTNQLSDSPHLGVDLVSPDGRFAWRIDGDANASLVLIDLKAGRELWNAPHGIDGVPVFLDANRVLAIPRSNVNSVAVFDALTGRQLGLLSGHADNIYGVAVSPDGSRIATCGKDQTIRLWDSETYEEMAQLRGHSGYVWSVAFSPDGESLVSGSGDGTVRIWDTKPRSLRSRNR